MSKIYLAGKFSEANNIRQLADSVSANITAPWYDFEQTNAAVRGQEETRLVGQKELDGVVSADYYIGIINDGDYPYKGTLAEMGIAMGWHSAKGNALKARVYLVTPKHFSNANCVALRVPHTALATHVPIMDGLSIIDNISVIAQFIDSIK